MKIFLFLKVWRYQFCILQAWIFFNTFFLEMQCGQIVGYYNLVERFLFIKQNLLHQIAIQMLWYLMTPLLALICFELIFLLNIVYKIFSCFLQRIYAHCTAFLFINIIYIKRHFLILIQKQKYEKMLIFCFKLMYVRKI